MYNGSKKTYLKGGVDSCPNDSCHTIHMTKNEAQEKAIHTVNGQMIMIACPGSGKTTTLIRRIHYMISEAGVNPEEILMVTFTNAAAKEMKKRYISQFHQNPGTTFCTIHSLCLAILRKFTSYTNEDIIMEYDVRHFFRKQLEKNRSINDKEEFITMLMTDIGVVKNNQIPLNEYKPKCCGDLKLFQNLYQAYEEFKEMYHKIDFDDMLIYAYDTMQTNPSCLNWLRSRYRYIQVDEYQDTNFLQRDIIYLLAGENPNLAVVGDDDQSIYGFRGAKPEVMLAFQKDFPRAEVIHMSTNYRSESMIIEKAGELIKRNSKRFLKDFVGFKTGEGKVETAVTENRAYEVDEVMGRIQHLINGGTDPLEIAILYRNNKQAMSFVDYCMENKIPFVCTEGLQDKYKHWIYYDICAFRRLANGTGSQLDFDRVLNHPQRYLNHPSYTKAGLNKDEMIRIAVKLNHEDWKRDSAVENILSFFAVIKAFKTGNPSEALDCMYHVGMYKKYLKDYAKYRNMEPDEFYEVWDSYVEDVKKAGNNWESWDQYIKIYENELNKVKNNEHGIVLSTMHRSKGLEWKHVFIVDCVNGITPSAKAENMDDFEEERRLFYVAMTRAKENLYLYTYRKNHSKKVEPSPYLDEMQMFSKGLENKQVKKSEKKKMAAPLFAVGDRVTHKSFGNGTITGVQDNKYIIRFDETDDEIQLSRDWVESKHMLIRI